MPNTAPECYAIHTAEKRNIAVDFRGMLDSGELLTGSPTVTEKTTTNLAITNAQINAAQVEINRSDVPIGMAVQFVVEADSGTEENSPYSLDIAVDTDAGQELVGRVQLMVDES